MVRLSIRPCSPNWKPLSDMKTSSVESSRPSSSSVAATRPTLSSTAIRASAYSCTKRSKSVRPSYMPSTPCQLVRWARTPVRLAAVVGLGVGHRRGPDVAAVRVRPAMPLGRRERRVHRLVGQVEQERTIRVAVAQELHRVVGQEVGGVALTLDAGPVHVQRRIDVRPLPPERDPVVKARTRVVARAPHVPLADERRLVAGVLEPDRERRQVAGHGGAVVEHLVGVGVESRQDRRPARRAQRGGDERVLEQDAALGKPVEVRRLEIVVAEPQPVKPLVVGEDEDDVPRLACAGARLLAAVRQRRRPERPRHHHARREPPCVLRHVAPPVPFVDLRPGTATG